MQVFIKIIFFVCFFLNFSNILKSEELLAYCLIKNYDLKQANLSEEEFSRFQGKVITFLISYDENLILDASEDPAVSVITGMYGVYDAQPFKKNSNGISYTNKIEVKGDTGNQKFNYKYNNKLIIVDGKVKSFYADVDQTGFSLNNWKFQIDCKDTEYTEDEILKAKSTGKPEWFNELVNKIKEGDTNIVGSRTKNYSLLIEEDYTGVIFLEVTTQKKKVTIIDYERFEPFKDVFNQENSNGLTFIQPANMSKNGVMESYMNQGFKINDFTWKYKSRVNGITVYSETEEFGNTINSYVASDSNFTFFTLRPEVAWYAGTYELVKTQEDLLKIYKKNPVTYCKILQEEISKNGKSLELRFVSKDFEDFNKRNSISCN